MEKEFINNTIFEEHNKITMFQESDTTALIQEMMDFLNESHDLSMDNFSSTTLLKDAGIDSFKIIELVLFLENKFNFHFPEEAYTVENLKSVSSILECASRVTKTN